MKVLTPVFGYRFKGKLKRGSKDPGSPTKKGVKRSRQTRKIRRK
jgi:hypothetical protein